MNETEKANLEKGSLALTTHGGYTFLKTGLTPGCVVCVWQEQCPEYTEGAAQCTVVDELGEQLTKNLMALPQISDQDILLVSELVRNQTLLWVLDRWIGKVGAFILEGQELRGQPVLKLRWQATNTIIRIASELGLSPMGRLKLRAAENSGNTLEDYIASRNRDS